MRWPHRVLAEFIADVVAGVVERRVGRVLEEQLTWHLINFTRETDKMNASLQRLMDEVEQTKTVTQSVVALVRGLREQLAAIKQELEEQGATSAKLDELASTLDENEKQLAGLVTANTPTDGTEAPPPAPEPEAPPVPPASSAEGGEAPPAPPAEGGEGGGEAPPTG